MEIKTRRCDIYVHRFVRYMSANELENLMTQLNVNSTLNIDDNHLGIQTIQGRSDWSYKKEKTHYRDGSERKTPLNDKVLDKKYDPPIYYFPRLNEFVIDEFNNILKTFPMRDYMTTKGSIKWEKLTKEQVIVLFWNEHWKRKGVAKAYYNTKNFVNRKAPNLLKRRDDDDGTGGGNGGGMRQPSYASTVTGGGRGGGSQANARRTTPANSGTGKPNSRP